jgi:hypothetical protein
VPITFHCTPCLANFSYIVEVDNMEEQMELIKRTNITQVIARDLLGGTSIRICFQFFICTGGAYYVLYMKLLISKLF